MGHKNFLKEAEHFLTNQCDAYSYELGWLTVSLAIWLTVEKIRITYLFIYLFRINVYFKQWVKCSLKIIYINKRINIKKIT